MSSLLTKTRTIAGAKISPIGLGCMNMSHAYGQPPSEAESIRLIHAAIDLGVTHFDTAALYGFGKNESLLGKALKGKRAQLHLASKCGMTGVNGTRVIDGRPDTIKQTIEQALLRLDTDIIDLYYLHRFDKKVPIEDSIGALADLVDAGKVATIGLSEVSAPTVKRAHQIHPIAAVQTEYSLWTRNVEIAVSKICEDLGIALVAFSPLGRGFLANAIEDPKQFQDGDIRKNLPRFKDPYLSNNLKLLPKLNEIAQSLNAAPSQVALAWLLHQGQHIVPIPGTTSIEHLKENMLATDLSLSDEILGQLDALINQATVSGPRYPSATQAEIDTEEFQV